MSEYPAVESLAITFDVVCYQYCQAFQESPTTANTLNTAYPSVCHSGFLLAVQ